MCGISAVIAEFIAAALSDYAGSLSAGAAAAAAVDADIQPDTN